MWGWRNRISENKKLEKEKTFGSKENHLRLFQVTQTIFLNFLNSLLNYIKFTISDLDKITSINLRQYYPISIQEILSFVSSLQNSDNDFSGALQRQDKLHQEGRRTRFNPLIKVQTNHQFRLPIYHHPTHKLTHRPLLKLIHRTLYLTHRSTPLLHESHLVDPPPQNLLHRTAQHRTQSPIRPLRKVQLVSASVPRAC